MITLHNILHYYIYIYIYIYILSYHTILITVKGGVAPVGPMAVECRDQATNAPVLF